MSEWIVVIILVLGLSAIYLKDRHIMATIDDVATRLEEESDVITNVVTLLDTISADLKQALASNDPAALDALIARIDVNKQSLAEAIARDTPGAESPVGPAPVDVNNPDTPTEAPESEPTDELGQPVPPQDNA